MNYRQLILSEEKQYRDRRYILLWVFFTCYFYLQSIGPKTYQDIFQGATYFNAILNLLCFGPVSILVIYLFSSTVMQLITKKQYPALAGFFITVFILGTAINYFAGWIYLSIADQSLAIPNNFLKRLEIASWNTRWAITMGVIVSGLQLVKRWYRQTTENLEMMKINARAETRVQKSRIHPGWLFDSLDKIQSNLQADAAGKAVAAVCKDGRVNVAQPHPRITLSAEMILHLSDILSYSLYDCDEDLVPLAMEMEGIEQLVLLEQKNEATSCLVDLKVDGNTEDKLVAPMSVINRVIEHVTHFPQRGDIYCRLLLHFTVHGEVLELLSTLQCDSKVQTEKINWTLVPASVDPGDPAGVENIEQSKSTGEL